MKKILFVFVTALGFVACSKNTDDQTFQPGSGENRIKTISEGTYKANYSYDANGRFTSIHYSDGSKTLATYSTNKAEIKKYDDAGALEQTYIHELNADGLSVKETRANNPSFQLIYAYNSDRQLSSYTQSNSGNTLVASYYYTNGNVDSIRFEDNGAWTTTVKFTYYTDKANFFDNSSYGQMYYGKRSKNLCKTEQYFSSNGSMGTPITYTYEFDAKGRAIKMKEGQGASSAVVDYEYY